MQQTQDISPNTLRINAGLKRRYRTERYFKIMGVSAILIAVTFLACLFASITAKGYTAFQQTYICLDVYFDEAKFADENLAAANYPGLVKDSLARMFPEVTGRSAKKQLYNLVSSNAAFRLRTMVTTDPRIIGTRQPVWMLADDDVDMLVKGHYDRDVPESDRRISNQQLAWINRLESEGKLIKKFNTTFFTAGDSREPEQAGIWGAVRGSIYRRDQHQ